jgi:proteasome accessory factor B
MMHRSTLKTLRQLAAAAAGAHAARIRFRDTDAADATREVDVVGLAFEDPRWLVATWSRALRSLRLLDLERIRSVRATARDAGAAPDGFEPDWFALRPLLGKGAATRLCVPAADGLLPPLVLPAGRWAPEGGACRTWIVHSCDPARVHALASSLGWDDALDSSSARLPDREGVDVASPEARILKVVSFILAQPGAVTAEQIFERFEDDYPDARDAKGRQARERMFSRDKNAIRRLGFVLAKTSEESYLIDPRSSKLPALELEPSEALAVWTAAIAALRHSDHPLRYDLESALRKLMTGWRGLPPRAGQTEELGADGGSPDGGAYLEDLAEAWLRRKRITIDYWKAARNEVETRQVDVYGWARRRGEWIFVGHCHLRDAVRIFYLSRVRKLSTPQAKEKDQPARGGKRRKKERSDDRAEYQIPADFDIRRWSRQQLWDYDVHPPKPAAVRFSGSLARIARDLVPGAKATTDAEGRKTLRLEVRNLRGLVRQALAWGPEAELIEPAEGRKQALEILAEARALGAGGRP